MYVDAMCYCVYCVNNMQQLKAAPAASLQTLTKLQLEDSSSSSLIQTILILPDMTLYYSTTSVQIQLGELTAFP